jgi:hypothetical protein
VKYCTLLPISVMKQEEALAEDRQRSKAWKKVIILAGAVVGGLVGWYYADTSPGLSIIVGVLAGAWVASMVWEFIED